MPLATRQPKKTGGFSWGRTVSPGGMVAYRLFRRDMRRVLHAELKTFRPDCSRSYIARELNIARHQLRNTVDDIDLEIMGVTG